MIRSDPLSAAVRPYRRRLALFAVLSSLVTGLTAGGFAFAAVTLGFKIAQSGNVRIPLYIAAGVGLTAFFLRLILTFPDEREAARRVDALGLKERTSTMLALRYDYSGLAAMQRQDALDSLAGAEKKRLRGAVSLLSAVLCLLALVLAVGSAFVPAAWFAREPDPMEQVWQDMLDMLRDERQRLETMGEEALAEEMDSLIDALENSDSVLQALGEINRAEEAAKDAARNGEASRGAMNEMLDVLEEAKRMLMEEEEAGEGEEGEGEPGMEMEMLMPGEEGGEGEGLMPGDMPGNMPGDMPGGDGEGRGPGSEGEGADGPVTKTEPVYDPISGSVPYGDVFSAYYREYLKSAENGEIPFEAQSPAKAYFNELNE